jgi:hypothetical protein
MPISLRTIGAGVASLGVDHAGETHVFLGGGALRISHILTKNIDHAEQA